MCAEDWLEAMSILIRPDKDCSWSRFKVASWSCVSTGIIMQSHYQVSKRIYAMSVELLQGPVMVQQDGGNSGSSHAYMR